MDPAFSEQLASLRQGFTERTSARPADASGVISDLDETIAALVGMKRGFEKSKEDMEAATWDEQIRVVDAELVGMGGEPRYEVLPPGFIHEKTFRGRCEVCLGAMRSSKDQMSKIDASRDLVEEKVGQALRGEKEHLEKALPGLDAQHGHWQNQLNGGKNCLLEFLESNSAMDAASFLNKKHKLLDKKLDLLMKKRWKEAGLGLAPSLP